MSAARELLADCTVIDIDIRGANTAEKLLYGMYLGDYVSYYLAMLNEVDPTPSSSLAFIEEYLAREEESRLSADQADSEIAE